MTILPQFVATPETERVRRTETVFIYNGASVLGMNATLDLLAPGLHVTLLPRVAMGQDHHR